MNKILKVLILILIITLNLSAEMKTTKIKGTIVKYYMPDISKSINTSGHNMDLKVMIHDPNPLPLDYVPRITKNSAIVKNLAIATSTTFSIHYLNAGEVDRLGESCYTFPDEAKLSFEAAAEIWAEKIDSSVPITIEACWGQFEGSTLGYNSSSSTVNFSNAPISDTYYSFSLANSIAGYDIHTDFDDMIITLNSSFSWYYGIDGNTPSDKTDLLTVLLHEIAHGLNFAGNMRYEGGSGYYDTYPSIYDRLIVDSGGVNLLDIPNNSTEMGNALTSNNLYFNGDYAKLANDGNKVKIYTPSTWESGSSYTHLDYDTFDNTSNELMVYSVSSGEVVHDPGNITLGMFKDMGWNMPLEDSSPVANAGIDQNVDEGSIVYLDGGNSYDPEGNSLAYSWSFVSKPSGSNAVLYNYTSSQPIFVADVSGNYLVKLIVNDGVQNSLADNVVIAVNSADNIPSVQHVKVQYKIVQTAGNTYVGTLANQTYSINPFFINSGDTITIIDQKGTNAIELVGGLTISSSIATSDELQITLNSGAAVNIRGASTFTYDVGANQLTGTEGLEHTFESFVTNVLGLSSVPTTGVGTGGSVDIIAGGEIINNSETIVHNGISYGIVTSISSGRIWLDRNLGATQICTSLYDNDCYGDYYQWGRYTDGHEKKDSLIVETMATEINNVGNYFIIPQSNTDWVNGDYGGTSRSFNWSRIDGTSICPKDFRVPTIDEIQAEISNIPISNTDDAYSSFLKLPSSGFRTSAISDMDTGLVYLWSSTSSGQYAEYLYVSSSLAYTNSDDRYLGFPVRCIKEVEF